MSDTPNGQRRAQPDEQAPDQAAGQSHAQTPDQNPDAMAADPSSAPESTPMPALEVRIAELEGQIGDLTDRLLRAHAEMDNVRKRAEREKQDTAKYAISKFARDIVGVADNFQRALGAVPHDAERSPALESLLEGVTMTEREFLNVLERNGVVRVDPKGEIFNPHLHQAVMEQLNPEVPAGTVLQVFQSGYVIEDRVLRPAMVVVATGGSKQPRTSEPPPAPGENGGEGGTTAA